TPATAPAPQPPEAAALAAQAGSEGGHGCCGHAHAAPRPAVEASPEAVHTCPMHPEIRQQGPGTCPKCGMALEPDLPTLESGEDPELVDFRRRFRLSLPLTAATVVLAMFGHRLGWFEMQTQSVIELVLTTPVVLWA